MSKVVAKYFLVVDSSRAKCLYHHKDHSQHFTEIWRVEVDRSRVHEKPREHPGRYQSYPGAPKSALNEPSKDSPAFRRYVASVVSKLEELFADEKDQHVVVIAAPVMMGVLRSAFPPSIRSRIAKEVLHNYTSTPQHRLEELLNELS